MTEPLKRVNLSMELSDVDYIWLAEYVKAGRLKRWRMRHRRRVRLLVCYEYLNVPSPRRRGRFRLWWATLRRTGIPND
jgi:hypothetical protein